MDNKKGLDLIRNILPDQLPKQRSADAEQSNIQKTLTRIRRQEGAASLIDFGIVRFWMIILQFFAVIYARNNRYVTRKPFSSPKI